MADPAPPSDPAATLDRLLALCDPVRRDLYFFVAERHGWVSRGEAADALGLRHGLVAHHLDRLADDGLLEVQYRRLTGRSGPGAGRPAKLYRRADEQHSLTIPPRNPVLVGQLLAAAIARSGEHAPAVKSNLVAVAHEAGTSVGAHARRRRSQADRRRGVEELLRTYGYEPSVRNGELSLANCPYAPLPERDRDLVCGMNLALVAGAVESAGLRGAACDLLRPDSGCCVRVRPWPDRSRAK